MMFYVHEGMIYNCLPTFLSFILDYENITFPNKCTLKHNKNNQLDIDLVVLFFDNVERRPNFESSLLAQVATQTFYSWLIYAGVIFTASSTPPRVPFHSTAIDE